MLRTSYFDTNNIQIRIDKTKELYGVRLAAVLIFIIIIELRAVSCSYQQEAVVPFVQFYHNTYVTHKILWFKQAVSSLNPNEESFSKIFKGMAHPPIFYYTCFCLTEDPTQTDQIISA